MNYNGTKRYFEPKSILTPNRRAKVLAHPIEPSIIPNLGAGRMKTNHAIPAPLLYRAALLVFLMAACSGPADSQKSKDASKPSRITAIPHRDPEKKLIPSDSANDFDPALLLSGKRTVQFAVTIPRQKTKDKPVDMRILLEGPSPFVLTLRVVVECATDAARKELESKLSDMQSLIMDHVSGKTPASVASAEGQDRLREELVLLMQRQMQNKAIKQIYFIQFFVAPGQL